MAKYYLTAAIPYVNAKPHLGHALEWFQADTLARFHRQLGDEVAFTCGTDENSLKNVQAAENAGQAVGDWLDEYLRVYQQAFAKCQISVTHFRRGSDQAKHWPGVQELWRRSISNGDIYQKQYEGLYCVGCEAYYTADELIDGLCPEHLKPPQLIKESNYFFRLSKYQAELEQLLSSGTLVVRDEQYRQEMLGFIHSGLEDFSVSRSVERARGVGVPVPDDASQVMYVWYDALTIYLTAIGWNYDLAEFNHWWPADTHVIGKGITRFHAVYWIGMLLSAGLPLPKSIHVHGYLTVEGQKMSKSLDNVVDPLELIEQYGREVVRYYLLRAVPTHADGDFSVTRLTNLYNSELANGVGNLASRISKLAQQSVATLVTTTQEFDSSFVKLMQQGKIDAALEYAYQLSVSLDEALTVEQPWKLVGEPQRQVMVTLLQKIDHVLFHLQPFIPNSAETLLQHFRQSAIVQLEPLFPRWK